MHVRMSYVLHQQESRDREQPKLPEMMRIKRERAFSYQFQVIYWFELLEGSLVGSPSLWCFSSSTKSLVTDESSRWLNVHWTAGYVCDLQSPKNPTVVTMVWWVAWAAKSSSNDAMKSTSREETFPSTPVSMKMAIVRSTMSNPFGANTVGFSNVHFWVWIRAEFWEEKNAKNSAPKNMNTWKMFKSKF